MEARPGEGRNLDSRVCLEYQAVQQQAELQSGTIPSWPWVFRFRETQYAIRSVGLRRGRRHRTRGLKPTLQDRCRFAAGAGGGIECVVGSVALAKSCY